MTVRIVKPRRFEDERGWFSETWHAARLAEEGIEAQFCQDNHSYSKAVGTLRGLHFQRPPHAQAKLVRCLRGSIYDVAIDIRRTSPTFGRWVGTVLSARLGYQLFIPRGYAHGFVTLETDCEVAYKVDAYYAPEADGGIVWNDPDLAIDWQLDGLIPVLSKKDAGLPLLADIDFDFAYDGNPLESLEK